MEDLEGDGFEDQASKREATKNARQIKSNVLKLVYHFRNDAMQAKLAREFRDASNNRSNNELGAFAQLFGQTKDLWFTKLATSVEEQ